MSSEFSSLLDLAVSRGHSHSQIVSDLKSQILDQLRDKFPKTPIDSEIMLDSESGKVKIFSEGQDITPAKFAEKAESLARQHLISLLAGSGSPKVSIGHQVRVNFPKFSGFFTIITNLIYWGYNLAFSFTAAAWLLSLVFSPDRPFLKLLISVILLAIPVSSLVLAVTRKFYKSSGQLLRTFFLIEVPLLLIAVLAVSIPEGANKFLWFTVLNLFLIPLVIFRPQRSYSASKFLLPMVFIKTMTLMIWGYLSFLFTFTLPGLIAGISRNIFGNIRFFNNYSPPYYYEDYYRPPTQIFDPGSIISLLMQIGWGVIVFAFFLSLILLPYFIFILLYHSFRQEPLSKFHTIFAVIVFTLSLGFSFQFGLGRMIKPMQTLASNTAAFTEKETAARLLSPQKDQLKKLIAQISFSRRSYLFTQDDHPFDSDLLNTVFLKLAYPFVYQGPDNIYDLQRAYDLLFSTYTTSTPAQNKLVLLSYRKVSYVPTPSQALAEITIEEEYDNQTNTNQEIIYEFSLYPGSVITGLRLGPDLEFPGQIAPKGAAQKTYESQLRINRDPALLEQIGTDTYRLRVFPVPGNRDFNTLKGKHQKVQFTYTTTATPDGFPLPVYTRQTNIYSSPASTYLLSKDSQLTKLDTLAKYLPSTFNPCSGLLPAGDLVQISCTDRPEIKNQQIAVVLDISLKNKGSANIDQLVKFAQSNQSFFSQNSVDLYKFNTEISDPVKITSLETPVFWGQPDLTGILPKITRTYDAVFIITGSDTALSATAKYPFSLNTSVYFIHKKIPSFPLEFTSKIIQGGGQISDSFDQSVTHYLLKNSFPAGTYLVNKYFKVSVKPDLVAETGTLANLTNSAKLHRFLQSSPTNILNNITGLDELNAFAKKASLVTPFSSLIALVNDQQQQILENFQNQYNRYEDTAMRENITPRPFTVSTTPGFAPLGNVDLFGTQKMMIGSSEMSGITSGGGTVNLALPTSASFSSEASAGSFGFSGIFGILILPLIFVLPLGFIYFIIKTLRNRKS